MGDTSTFSTSDSGTDNNSQALSFVHQHMKTVVNPQSQLITTHLEEDNYLLWKFQVETAICGYDLEDFVLDTLPIPPRFTTDKEIKTVTDEEYIKYNRQDRMICS